jgi:hypothetical protein
VVWKALAILLVGLVGACKGSITSTEPLLTPRNASFPLASGTQMTGQRLGDDNVWQNDDPGARILLVDGYYRIIDPDQAAPGPDSFLFQEIGDGEFIVQASNGHEWAYALIVRADMDYLFAFNRAGQNCTNLSDDERTNLRVVISDDRCMVGNQHDLTALLRYLRRRFPYPTSAFSVLRTRQSDRSPVQKSE